MFLIRSENKSEKKYVFFFKFYLQKKFFCKKKTFKLALVLEKYLKNTLFNSFNLEKF